MKKQSILLFLLLFVLGGAKVDAQKSKVIKKPVTKQRVVESSFTNPLIYSDVPDMSMIRVGDAYYMSSTTMHMSPGVPIMKSKDLVNWKIINYAYDTLANVDALNLVNGKSTYGKGSWASTIRYHKGLFYVTTFAQTTDKTYIYTTRDIEKGPWKSVSFKPAYHDCNLFLDEDGRNYLIYGNGKLSIVELNKDMTGVKPETNRVLIENASAPSGNGGLGAEGSQLFKVKGKYYLLNITWPSGNGSMRTVVLHRADNLNGPWEGKVALKDKGLAQGGLIDTPDGRWFSYLFQDCGAVGRIPYLVPVQWEDSWPVFGVNGKAPTVLDLPASKGVIPFIVNNDEFDRKKGEAALPLVWQWNHNPDNSLWSVTERKGFLRLKTNRIDTLFLKARNTLTQRTFGPVCSGITKVDVTNLKEGDYAGLCALQRKFGLVGVKVQNGTKCVYMVSNKTDNPTELESVKLSQNVVFLKIECDFRNKMDVARFFYSLDGKTWKVIGGPLKMEYTLMEHFMGYRFGLYNYSSKNPGGYVDFDYFHIIDTISEK
ncbi:MAG: glycoside hydrolase 43 family protein [Dysgonamonadaceae bacterium]